MYTIGAETRYVNWLVGDTDIYYEFIDGDGNVENESYSRTGPRPTGGGNPTRYESQAAWEWERAWGWDSSGGIT